MVADQSIRRNLSMRLTLALALALVLVGCKRQLQHCFIVRVG
jgi:hypothetical protein